MATAAERVLDTAELLEMILLAMHEPTEKPNGLADILKCERVNKTFRNVINTSPSIGQLPCFDDNPELSPCKKWARTLCTCASPHAGFHAQLQSGIRTTDGHHMFINLSHFEVATIVFRFDNIRFAETASGSWRKVRITKGDILIKRVQVVYGPPDRGCVFSVDCDVRGPTLGQLLDMWLEAWQLVSTI